MNGMPAGSATRRWRKDSSVGSMSSPMPRRSRTGCVSTSTPVARRQSPSELAGSESTPRPAGLATCDTPSAGASTEEGLDQLRAVRMKEPEGNEFNCIELMAGRMALSVTNELVRAALTMTGRQGYLDGMTHPPDSAAGRRPAPDPCAARSAPRTRTQSPSSSPGQTSASRRVRGPVRPDPRRRARARNFSLYGTSTRTMRCWRAWLRFKQRSPKARRCGA